MNSFTEEEKISFMIDVLGQHSDLNNIHSAIFLGSGLENLKNFLKNPIGISMEELKFLKVPNVSGHGSSILIGEIQGKKILCFTGRVHFYEGYDLKDILRPIDLVKKLGIKNLILTNAAGGVNPLFNPGDIVIIKDHIAFNGINPLIGPNDPQKGPRFPDQSEIYNKNLRNTFKLALQDKSEKPLEGVYFYSTGPSYETPAEVKSIAILGGDLVGMSTIYESIYGNYLGLEILGLSMVTNMAAGISKEPLSHQEVMEISKLSESKFIEVLIKYFEIVN